MYHWTKNAIRLLSLLLCFTPYSGGLKKLSRSPICTFATFGSQLFAPQCHPQTWGAPDTVLQNASIIFVGLACSSISVLATTNLHDLHGYVALSPRGKCPFEDKVRNVKQLGAIGAMLFDPTSKDGMPMKTTGTPISVPILTVSREDGTKLEALIQSIPHLQLQIAYSDKWALEDMEDESRRRLSQNISASDLLTHGAALASLGRDGEAVSQLKKGRDLAKRQNLQGILHDLDHNLLILQKREQEESHNLWEEFLRHRHDKSLLFVLKYIPEWDSCGKLVHGKKTLEEWMQLGSSLSCSPPTSRYILEFVCFVLQFRYGIDLSLRHDWPDSNSPLETSDRYGSGLSLKYWVHGNNQTAERTCGVQHHDIEHYRVLHELIQEECEMTVSLEFWRFLSASYAVVGVNTLVHLLKINGICVSVMNPPLYEGGWKHQDGLFDVSVETVLQSLPLSSKSLVGHCPDVVLRMYFPFDFEPFPCNSTRTFVFGTTEFGLSSDRALKKAMEWDEVHPSITLITPSNWSAEGFVRSGVPRKQIWILPHGIDPSLFHPPVPKKRADLRRVFGWDEEELIFFNLGMLSRNKGISELLLAFNRVWKWHHSLLQSNHAFAHSLPQKLRLVLKGPSHIPPHIDAREIREGNHGDTWFFEGSPVAHAGVDPSAIQLIANSSIPTSQLAGMLGAADIYISPYKAEGFNLPVLEAMACGTPPIVTRGGPTDDFTTPDLARYVRSTRVPGSMAAIADLGQDLVGYELQVDIDDLEQQMKFVIVNKTWRTEASRRASAYAHETFSWEALAGQMRRKFSNT